jgi:energy-converting hydrogenase Eha subunit F
MLGSGIVYGSSSSFLISMARKVTMGSRYFALNLHADVCGMVYAIFHYIKSLNKRLTSYL